MSTKSTAVIAGSATILSTATEYFLSGHDIPLATPEHRLATAFLMSAAGVTGAVVGEFAGERAKNGLRIVSNKMKPLFSIAEDSAVANVADRTALVLGSLFTGVAMVSCSIAGADVGMGMPVKLTPNSVFAPVVKMPAPVKTPVQNGIVRTVSENGFTAVSPVV